MARVWNMTKIRLPYWRIDVTNDRGPVVQSAQTIHCVEYPNLGARHPIGTSRPRIVYGGIGLRVEL